MVGTLGPTYGQVSHIRRAIGGETLPHRAYIELVLADITVALLENHLIVHALEIGQVLIVLRWQEPCQARLRLLHHAVPTRLVLNL